MGNFDAALADILPEPEPVLTAEAIRRFLLADEPWRERAKCRGMGAEGIKIFFPYRGESKKPAKALCARCPVQKQCDEYAERTNSTYGIWGGRMRHRGPEGDDDGN